MLIFTFICYRIYLGIENAFMALLMELSHALLSATAYIWAYKMLLMALLMALLFALLYATLYSCFYMGF